jgi:phytol kinase
MNQLGGISLVLGGWTALMIAVRFWQHRAQPHPEVARKLVHGGMGAGTLSLPWLFDSDGPVIVLACVAVVCLAWIRRFRPAGLDSVLFGVRRFSFGEFYFPIAVASLFVLTRGQWLLYCIPLIILTLADTAGALIGSRFGELKFRTRDGWKTVEGSGAFFVTAFLSAAIPLSLWGVRSPVDNFLVSLVLGFLVMLLEAIAWRGLDNLIIPLASFLLLQEYLRLPTAALAARLLAMLLLVAVMLLLKPRTSLAGSAALGAALVLYASWALGGWWWLLAPAVVLVVYLLCFPPARDSAHGAHSTDAVLAVAGPGMALLFVSSVYGWRNELLMPCFAAYGAQIAMLRISFLEWRNTRWPHLLIGFHGLILGAVFIQAVAFVAPHPGGGTSVVFSLVSVAFASIAFICWQIRQYSSATNVARWLRQGAIGLLASLIALIPLLIR